MSTIRKRSGKFQAQVRIKGSDPISRTFETRAEAQRWARSIEVAIDDGSSAVRARPEQSVTLGQILTRYREEITPLKKGIQREQTIIRTAQASLLWNVIITELTEEKAATYRNIRSKSVKPATVVRELALLAHALEVARRDWGCAIKMNCFKMVRKPAVRNGRSRRLTDYDKDCMFSRTHSNKITYTMRLAEFALETAMRKGEMLNIRNGDIDFRNHTLVIPRTKNGYARTIPLSPRAMELLQYGIGLSTSDYVFHIGYWTLARRWTRFKRKFGINDLTWHDLRHESVSMFFEKGLSVPEVALISGHRDTKLLARYTHIRPGDVALKLAQLYT